MFHSFSKKHIYQGKNLGLVTSIMKRKHDILKISHQHWSEMNQKKEEPILQYF